MLAHALDLPGKESLLLLGNDVRCSRHSWNRTKHASRLTRVVRADHDGAGRGAGISRLAAQRGEQG